MNSINPENQENQLHQNQSHQNQPDHQASTSDPIVEQVFHQFADPVNQNYLIDTRQHILESWHAITQDGQASQYSKDEIRQIKDRIQHAARKIGFEIHGG